MPQLELRSVSAAYERGGKVLDDVSLAVDKGEIVSVIGPSGSGKSTLLRVLTGLLRPIAGEVWLDQRRIDFDSKRDLRSVRSRVAIVFQQFNLFQNMTALTNVTITPIKVRREPRSEVEQRACALLRRVGLDDKLRSYPDELSGGQQQRVAVARAVVNDPKLILADEPTGNLDTKNGEEVMEMLRVLNEQGATILMVTHSPSHAERAHRTINLLDGRVVAANKLAI